MTETEAQILALLSVYKEAVLAKDVDAFVALYDDDVCVFDMWGTWSYRGLPAWREMATGWFQGLGPERVAVEFEGHRIVANQDLGTVYAFVTFTGLSDAGEMLRSMHNRLTWTVQRKAGVWKVVHEHTSAPIDFASAKVMLERSGT